MTTRERGPARPGGGDDPPADARYAPVVADFASALDFDDIPSDVVDRAVIDIMDALGCAMFGQNLTIARQLERALLEPAGAGPATIWGSDRTAAPETASLVNGTLVHSFELDDLHHTAILHPGGVALSAALALGESVGVSGRDLLTAQVVGIEVSSRVGLAVGPSMLGRGWHNNGVLGVFASASAASRVLRLDPAATRNALGVAGSLAAGLMASQYGSMVKRMHAGHAAQTGVRSAVLAREGFTGIDDIFAEGYGNFLPAFADSWDRGELTSELGRRWETSNVGFKRFSCCGSNHSTIDVLLDLRARHSFVGSDVDEIAITCSSSNREHVGWPYRPDTVTTAQMNLAYCAAVTLIDGECFVEQFVEERLDDPAVLALVDRVRITADPAIDARGRAGRHEVTVDVRLRDGRRLRGAATSPRGSASAPLTQDELIAKFVRLASTRMDRGRVDVLVSTVQSLPDVSDVRDMTKKLSLRGA
ncbi:MAG: MmgE/PrpD family protein [Streptosporangiales bacterium]|nr:MmgE/PrpD family protein [Streptosporangiales bacterium]